MRRRVAKLRISSSMDVVRTAKALREDLDRLDASFDLASRRDASIARPLDLVTTDGVGELRALYLRLGELLD